jgi:hypothetical protein
MGGYEYQDKPLAIEFADEVGNQLNIGNVLFSQAGVELAGLCDPSPVEGFVDYLVGQWIEKSNVVGVT